jgi:hypothetical protein
MKSVIDRASTAPSFSGVERLEAALRRVLGESFEANLREMVEGSAWYHEDLPYAESFRLWICDNLECSDDPQWIFQPVRAAERKYLCDELGIQRAEIVGKNPRQLANLVMSACGLPSQDLDGLRALREAWNESHRLVKNDEDERAAMLCRQRAERLLRELLMFYCGIGFGEHFIMMLQDSGTLRVPGKFRNQVMVAGSEDRLSGLMSTLSDESIGDLGFLSLALRKFSARVEDAGERHVCGESLRIFGQAEHAAFNVLGTALQAYHHDRPSKRFSRKGDLLMAIEGVQETIETMIGRRVVPDELFVTEASCKTPVGRAFRGRADNGRIRCLTAEVSPALGYRIRFIAAADRDYARCLWRLSMWGSGQR